MSNTRKMMSGFITITALAMVVSLTLVNCGGGGGGGGNASSPAEPSAQEKIAAALAAGTIDYGTSLLYRAYVFYGDARLPAEYLGSGSNEEDNGLRSEMVTAGSTSAGLQAAFEPFTVRPADPKSWYNQTVVAKARPGSGAKASAPASGWTWISTLSGKAPVRVWAQSNGDSAYELSTTMAIADTLDIIDKIWTPMTALMGEPILDKDGDIDIYIVDWLSSVYRRGEERTAKGFAVAFPDFPVAGKTTSGFILIPRSTLASKRFHTTVIHEFFHVLQKAHNNDISNSWFTEASARWASVYYDRTLAPWKNGRAAYEEAHHTFTERFQKSKESLNATTQPQMYDAYIWAYFLEQETGGPDVIGAIWDGLNTANNIVEADNAIANLFPFEKYFRAFAVRNVNTEFLPGDPLPFSSRYISLDSEFRDDKKEPTYGGGPLTGDSELPYSATLEPLFADYLKFTVSDPAVKQVVFDLSGLAAEPGLDVDVLIKTKGKDWEKRDLNGQAELKFCVDKDGEALDDIRFILSNHKYGPGESVLATFTARSYTTPCPGTWSGPFSYTYALQDSLNTGGTLTIVWSGTATWGNPVVASNWSTDYSLVSIVATVTVDGVEGIGAYDCTYHGSKDVTLSDFTPSQDVMWLTVNGSYFASLGAATTLTLTYTCPDPSNNSVQPDYFVGLPWWTATSDGSFYSLDVDKHMKGTSVLDASPFIETYTWDFVYAVQ